MIDHTEQTNLLIASLLKSRGTLGATQTQIEKVVLWARGVHTETAEMATLAKRPRLRKAELSGERQMALDLNKALLEGVISGTLAVDVNEADDILFRGVEIGNA